MSQLKLFQNELVYIKQDAAKLAFEFLIKELKEPKEADISEAGKLKDIYDCKVCLEPVAQMYVKGIMDSDSEREFGMRRTLLEAELVAIEERLFDTTKRKPRLNQGNREKRYIELKEAMTEGHVLFIDVRSELEAREMPLQGAVNIPLSKIALNPHMICEDKWQKIVFACKSGTEASIAADYALSAGFKDVLFTSAPGKNY